MANELEEHGSEAPGGQLFSAAPRRDAPLPVLPWLVAGGLIALVALGLILAGHRKPVAGNQLLALDPYASSLVFSSVTMSESTSLSGGKSTYLDGMVRNKGTRVVTGATLQVLFANAEGLPPQVETVPLALVRTREPYVDTEPVSAAPLAPGSTAEFRLIFEDIGNNWNQQVPELHVVRVALR